MQPNAPLGLCFFGLIKPLGTRPRFLGRPLIRHRSASRAAKIECGHLPSRSFSLPDTLQTAASGCEEPANPAVITQRSKDSPLGGLASAVPHFASPAANQGRASTEELGASFIAAGLNWVSRRFAMAHEAHCCPGARLLRPCLALCCALRFPREE
jgi:hypothetical protein